MWWVCCFGKKKCFKAGFERVQRGFLLERKGEVTPCRGAEDGKGTRANSGKSDMRNLEPESIRGRAEITGGCVKFKTVTKVKWSNAHDMLIAGSVYLLLNSQ